MLCNFKAAAEATVRAGTKISSLSPMVSEICWILSIEKRDKSICPL